MIPRFTISVRYIDRIFRVASAAGADIPAMRSTSWPELRFPLNFDDRISPELYLRIWKDLIARLGDPHLPLRVAQSGGHQADDVLWFACTLSANLGEAIQRFVRYSGNYTSLSSWSFNESDDRVTLTLERPRALVGLDWRHADEFAMALMASAARNLTGVDLSPVEVCFEHDEIPAGLAAFLRAPVRLCSGCTCLVLSRSALAVPVTRARPALSNYFEAQAQEALGEKPHDLQSQLRRLLTSELPGGPPDLRRMAAKLHLSERTLRRRLVAEGTTFQAFVDELRLELARRRLAQVQIPIAEVSFLLGYSQPTAFHRAFRRWTGMTPQEYRDSLPER